MIEMHDEYDPLAQWPWAIAFLLSLVALGCCIWLSPSGALSHFGLWQILLFAGSFVLVISSWVLMPLWAWLLGDIFHWLLF